MQFGVATIKHYRYSEDGTIVPEKNNTISLMEFGKQPKRMAVGFSYNGKFSVFPQFVSVPDFDISEAFGQVILYSGKINVLISCEIVGPTVVSAMAIAEKYDFRLFIDKKLFAVFKNFIQTFRNGHGLNLKI
jgi:hypothetical protein